MRLQGSEEMSVRVKRMIERMNGVNERIVDFMLSITRNDPLIVLPGSEPVE